MHSRNDVPQHHNSGGGGVGEGYVPFSSSGGARPRLTLSGIVEKIVGVADATAGM